MNGSAAVADDKGVVDDPVRGPGRDIGNIQIDLLAPSAVGIYQVTAGLARSEGKRAVRSQPIAGVIDLRKTSLAVKRPDADDDVLRYKRENRERVIALERRVRAPVVIRALCPGHTAQRWQSDRSRQRSIPKPAFHLPYSLPNLFGGKKWLFRAISDGRLWAGRVIDLSAARRPVTINR